MARDSGAAYGRRKGFIVLAPEFSERYYPGDTYAFGNMVDSAGRLRPQSQWALSAIDRPGRALPTRRRIKPGTLCLPDADGRLSVWVTRRPD
jgi:hypothetical protein